MSECFKNLPLQREFRFVEPEGRPGVWNKFNDKQAMNTKGRTTNVNDFEMVKQRTEL